MLCPQNLRIRLILLHALRFLASNNVVKMVRDMVPGASEVSKDERLKVGDKGVKNKLKASCQDLRPGVVQLTNYFLECIKGWQAHHPLWESIPLHNCNGIKEEYL